MYFKNIILCGPCKKHFRVITIWWQAYKISFHWSGLIHAAGWGLSSNLWRDTICQTRILVGNNMEDWSGLSYMAQWPMARANTTLYCRQNDNEGKKCQSWLMQHFNSESGMHSIRRGDSSCRAYLGAAHRSYCSGNASQKNKRGF